MLLLWFWSLAAAPQEGTLIVANRTGGSISFIDLPTGVEVARVPIGPIIPHEVAVSPDGTKALTGEYGPEDNHGSHIVLIDVVTATIDARIDLDGLGSHRVLIDHHDSPDGMAWTPTRVGAMVEN